jgi:hypothetical protein
MRLSGEAKARQKGLVDHNDPADFSRQEARALLVAKHTFVILRCSPHRGEPRRIGHERRRLRRSFETPRKRAAPQDDG